MAAIVSCVKKSLYEKWLLCRKALASEIFMEERVLINSRDWVDTYRVSDKRCKRES